jgi:pimeloyl-ACP methyl ester carboxylesterase
MADLRDNPHALPDAPAPRVHIAAVNGTSLYAEVRGEGPPVLIIAGGAEDAEGWRPVAERLDGHTVVTYDRRGTMRSGRHGWPGAGAAQHADDAAALLDLLGLHEVVVLGGSSGGVVAVRLAISHPASVRLVLAHEPGFLRSVPAGRSMQAATLRVIDAHLERHPGDWGGAYEAFAGALAPDPAPGSPGYLADPDAFEWHARREAMNAEPFVRDDVPLLTTEDVDETALANCTVAMRFSYGSRSGPLFRDIAAHLASVRGDTPDVIDGAGHALYLAPALAAAYIHRCSRHPAG